MLQVLKGHLQSGEAYDVEYRLRAGPDEYRWFNDRGQAIWDSSGKAVRMSGSLRDLSDVKKGMARGYPGTVDLTEPLRTIEGFRQAMLEGRAADRDSEGQVFASRLSREAKQVGQLVRPHADPLAGYGQRCGPPAG